MSFASLAGGAECGPVNPLAQLSKTFAQDRGVQQDQFGSHAGSSKQGFRQSPAGPSTYPATPTDPTASRFFQPHSQPFDLSSLNRALTPTSTASSSSAAGAGAVPAWAQAFNQNRQHAPPPPVPAAHSSQEHEMFARAFGRPASSSGPAWAGEFSKMGLPALGPAAVQHAQPVHQPLEGSMQGPAPGARLYGQGFVNGGGMMQGMHTRNYASPLAMNRSGEVRDDATMKQRDATDWETAFLAQEATTSTSTLTEADASSTSRYLDHVTETRPLTPPLRAHSPIEDSKARDALAQTAAALLSTVRTSEDQRLRTGGAVSQAEQVAFDIGDKFAQSTFMDLMRRLRDGEVAVEGDQVVEQTRAGASTSTKGKARAEGWATDFAAGLATREEEGRANASTTGGAPPVLRPGEPIDQFARAQHDWASRQANSASIVREAEEGYRTMEGLWDDEDRVRAQREREQAKGKAREEERPLQFQGDGGSIVPDEEQLDTRVHLAQASWEEDLDDPSLISGGHAQNAQARRTAPSAQQAEWDLLQSSWDDFEVTAAGIKPKDASVAQRQDASTSSAAYGYSFSQNNPYLLHQRENAFASASTHHHTLHGGAAISDAAAVSSARIDSLLQNEAAVQIDPQNASAWFSLGLKQQENEREELAIAALQRAIELDPTVAAGAAHLNLAISYTNESRRGAAYEQIDKWIDVLSRSSVAGGDSKLYANEISQYRNLFGPLPENVSDRHPYLTNLLIRLAQTGAESMGNVDADVQVAMGVLFNSSEEYEKAGDCFEAALAVRPDDPLLFNRLGATHANSGKTDLAIQYYHAALDIQPGYVRARYNLAVANMNLGNYEEAIHHLLTSLSVQEADAEHEHLLDPTPSNAPQHGITSQTLWDSLKLSLVHHGRMDLSDLAQKKDLQAIMREFDGSL